MPSDQWVDLPSNNKQVDSDWVDVPHQGDGVLSRLNDPDRWKAILTGTGPKAPEVIQGDVPLVIPGSAAPALAGAATKLAGNFLGRLGTSTGVGTVQGGLKTPQEGETRLGNAAKGGALGLATGVGAEGLSALFGAGKALVKGVIPGSKEANAARVAGELNEVSRDPNTLEKITTPKQVSINPQEYLGKDPEVDEFVKGQMQGNPVTSNPRPETPPSSPYVPSMEGSVPFKGNKLVPTGERQALETPMESYQKKQFGLEPQNYPSEKFDLKNVRQDIPVSEYDQLRAKFGMENPLRGPTSTPTQPELVPPTQSEVDSFKQNVVGKIPDQMQMTGEKFDGLRKLLAKNTKYEMQATKHGLKPVATNPELEALSAKTIKQEHAISPGLDKELSEQSANLRNNANLKDAFQSLNNGDVKAIPKLAALPVVAAGGGALRSLMKSPGVSNNPAVGSILDQLLQQNLLNGKK